MDQAQDTLPDQLRDEAALATLPGRRFTRGLELGLGDRPLSTRLASQCDAFLGLDLWEGRGRPRRHAGSIAPRGPHMRIPAHWPHGVFDLIVLSEILPRLSLADHETLAERCIGSLTPGGVVVLVNGREWRGGRFSGDAAAMSFLAVLPERWPALNMTLLPRYRVDQAVRQAR